MTAPATPVTVALETGAEVSGLWRRPDRARASYVLAHGAGAGMTHPFLEGVSADLGARGVATLRFQFPFMQAGGRRVDRPEICHTAVRAAVATARGLAPDLPLVAGGRSFGGRMTSQAHAAAPLPDVRGLCFLGFPLHPAGRPGSERARHLDEVALPMLFVQGSRDALAEPDHLRPVCARLGERATLRLIEGADHSFTGSVRAQGRTALETRALVVDAILAWLDARVSENSAPG